MIVKKPYRKIRFEFWNKKRNKYEHMIVTDYIGWFLFGCIPLYLIVLDKYTEVDYYDTEEPTKLTYGVVEKYAHLMINNK